MGLTLGMPLRGHGRQIAHLRSGDKAMPHIPIGGRGDDSIVSPPLPRRSRAHYQDYQAAVAPELGYNDRAREQYLRRQLPTESSVLPGDSIISWQGPRPSYARMIELADLPANRVLRHALLRSRRNLSHLDASRLVERIVSWQGPKPLYSRMLELAELPANQVLRHALLRVLFELPPLYSKALRPTELMLGVGLPAGYSGLRQVVPTAAS
jgi:hypothetical protein